MKARFISESIDFNRDNPNIFRKIGIGIRTMSKLEKWDILKPKSEMIINKGKFGRKNQWSGYPIEPYNYLLITKVDYQNISTKNDYSNIVSGLIIEFLKFEDEKEALSWKRNKQMPEIKGEYKMIHRLEGSIKQFENRFTIYEG